MADSVTELGERCIGRIPVRNLWLLMLYASDLYRSKSIDWVKVEECPDDLPGLVAQLLLSAVEKRLRRRLTRSYVQRRGDLHRVRGRIDLLATERRQLLSRAKVACCFEDLSIDTPRHRLVRHALDTLAAMVNEELAHRCRVLAATLRAAGVTGTAPTRAVLSTDRISRHDADDQAMVDAAILALELAVPTEEAGTRRLPRAEREETWVRKLFERAVGGFYEVQLRGQAWSVRRGQTLHWQIGAKTNGLDAIFPTMRTDIVLEQASTGRRLVIDTKFSGIVSAGRFRKESLSSGYLYQIYAYVMSQVGLGDPLADRASGVLLHPSIEVDVDESVTVQDHVFRFLTVNLAADAGRMRSDLLRVTQECQLD